VYVVNRWFVFANPCFHKKELSHDIDGQKSVTDYRFTSCYTDARLAATVVAEGTLEPPALDRPAFGLQPLTR
jgi:hypothetical protein